MSTNANCHMIGSDQTAKPDHSSKCQIIHIAQNGGVCGTVIYMHTKAAVESMLLAAQACARAVGVQDETSKLMNAGARMIVALEDAEGECDNRYNVADPCAHGTCAAMRNWSDVVARVEAR